jgi:hypothetical protein
MGEDRPPLPPDEPRPREHRHHRPARHDGPEHATALSAAGTDERHRQPGQGQHPEDRAPQVEAAGGELSRLSGTNRAVSTRASARWAG